MTKQRFKDVEITINQKDLQLVSYLLREEIRRGECVIEQGVSNEGVASRVEDAKRVLKSLRRFRAR